MKTVDHIEQEQVSAIVARIQEAANSNWVIGEQAAIAKERYGLTDEALAEMTGVDRSILSYSRLVWERFGFCDSSHKISWTHYRASLGWQDAEHWLQLAAETGLSVKEMQRARSLSMPADAVEEQADEAELVTEDKPEPQEQPKRRPPKKQKAEDNPETAHAKSKKEAAAKQEPPKTLDDTGDDDPPDIDGALRLMQDTIERLAEPADCKMLASKFRAWADLLDPPKKDPATGDELLAAWNDIAGVTPCRGLNAKRKTALRERMKEPGWDWREAIDRLHLINWIKGDNERGWRADIDWFLRPNTVTRILEGAYDDREARAKSDRYTAAIREAMSGDW